ncbi:uncharacterized protein LOC132313214 isoform X2 [Cornus florida]|uniref:uncharacterized protein LOC132313214 isoform X2 n=1 Tax=Cornus florida TaxID=4283 RepID=UPI00289CE577|nr:uncharacterized protein LOC132313214 isoform X2 [Cornus florida]
MAEDLDDGEFWLPPQILTDEDILMDYSNTHNLNKSINGDKTDSGFCFPLDFSYGFGSSATPYSDLSSPVESVVGSTETESDEEDFITGLTRKMAHSTLLDELWKTDTSLGCENQKTWPMSGSPQSTLCGVIGGCGCKKCSTRSSRGSPNCASQLSSPPPSSAAMSMNEAAYDLLYAAAGKVARLRMIEERIGCYENRGILAPPRRTCPVSAPLKKANPNPNPNTGFHSNSNPSLSYQQLQFEQLRQQQMMKQQQGSVGWGQSKGTWQNQVGVVQNRAPRNGSARPLGLSSSAWPTLQQSQQQQHPQPQAQPGSGMRAVFLGNHGAKRECAGTGVFLPRRIGTPTETRKKPACSTVLLPDRVVQALNLKLDTMDAQSQFQSRYNRSLSPEYDAAVKYRNNVLMAQELRNVRPQPAVHHEVRLPQEWTY